MAVALSVSKHAFSVVTEIRYPFFRPYLNASKREILADYALPFAVIIMSFFGSYVFRGVKCKYIFIIILQNYILKKINIMQSVWETHVRKTTRLLLILQCSHLTFMTVLYSIGRIWATYPGVLYWEQWRWDSRCLCSSSWTRILAVLWSIVQLTSKIFTLIFHATKWSIQHFFEVYTWYLQIHVQVKEGFSVPLGYDGNRLLEWLHVILWFTDDPWRLASLSTTRTCSGRCRRLRRARACLPKVS